jgi:hypothetical protein
MPEVCQMFKAMTPEGRLAVIQKKQLCQFCFRHPDTQPCPSQSLPACPIRGCIRMHHRMLHRALMQEEARPIVLGAVSSPGEHGAGENLLTSDSEDSTLVTSDESEGERPGKSRLCMQMVPVEANGIMHGLHTLGLGIYSDSGEERVDEEDGILASAGGTATRQWVWRSHVPVTGCHFLPLVDVHFAGEASGDLCLRGGGDHHCGGDEVTPVGSGGISVCQGTHAVDGHQGGPN